MAQSTVHTPRNILSMTKSRNAALRFRNGSPKFKDFIRERFRNRIKENRQKFVDLRRNSLSSDLKQTLTDTLRNELIGLCTKYSKEANFELMDDAIIEQELATFEEIASETRDIEVEQIMTDYDALIANEDFIFTALQEDDFEIPECPVCEKGTIVLSSSHILCTHCNIAIQAQTSLQELCLKIETANTSHRYKCPVKLNFIASDHSLFFVCASCSYTDMIV